MKLTTILKVSLPILTVFMLSITFYVVSNLKSCNDELWNSDNGRSREVGMMMGGGASINENKHLPNTVNSSTRRHIISSDNSPINDSSDTTVMAMASGYDLETNKMFVGSLRKSGYKGHIILAVKPDIDPEVKTYLEENNVTIKFIKQMECTYTKEQKQDVGENEMNEGMDFDSALKEALTCLYPYPELKQRWSRFPLLRDYLLECKSCTGPVLVTDFRDAYFQRDPFGDNGHDIVGLEVFEEYHAQRTSHWLVDGPVRNCKGDKETDTFLGENHRMLCSGTTIGTREATLDYLRIMHGEMMKWMLDSKCRNHEMNGDDQSIHNYLFYAGRLPFAVAVPNRQGIVNTVGVQGSMIKKQYGGNYKMQKNEYQGADEDNGQWIGIHYDVTDKEGYFTNSDGTRSRVVHQYDRYGDPLDRWLDKQEGILW